MKRLFKWLYLYLSDCDGMCKYCDEKLRKRCYEWKGISEKNVVLAVVLMLFSGHVTGQCSSMIDEPFVVSKGLQTSCVPVMAYDTQEVRIETNFQLPAGKYQQMSVTYSAGQEVEISIHSGWNGWPITTLPASRDSRTVVVSYNHSGEFIQFSSGAAPIASWLIVEAVCFDEIQQQPTVICLPVWLSSQGRRVK